MKWIFTQKVTGLLVLFCMAACTVGYSQTPKWELATPKYPTAEAFVIGFNVMDYGADPTGETDQTKLFQSLLDKLGSRSNNYGRLSDGAPNGGGFGTGTPNGGILYVPEGKYLFEGSLFIPKGVTIRGEWEKPVKGQPIKGTILMPTKGRGMDAQLIEAYESVAFITMQPSTSVRDVNIWYPDQDANKIVAYPPAILFGQQGYWGNDYCLASNITLVNAYDGVMMSRRAGGGAPNCYGIYGSPLKRGIEIDNIAEIGRVDNVDFSSDYWAGSGLPGSPALNGPHKQYIADNGTAVIMRRIDWSFVGNIKAERYNIGFRLDFSYNLDENKNYTSPNGHFYAMDFTDCKYGVYAAAVSDGAGTMFYDFKFNNCEYGFYVASAKGTMQISGGVFDTEKATIHTPLANATKVIMNQSVINRGPVDLRGGLSSIINCTFNDDGGGDQIRLGRNARAIITGNKFKNNQVHIKNVSMYDCVIDHTPVEMTALPSFPYQFLYDFKQKPSGNNYRLATAGGVSATANDNSDALQTLLNEVATAGGGVVFLPPGHFNFRKPITIPAGVELKGSVDNPSLPTGPGSTMEIYAGKGDENGTPFITMQQGSGIRGLILNYPEQMVQLLTDPSLNNLDVYHYPYVIQGNKDVYIVNIAFRAVYKGIDLFTNKCDNFFVDYPAGHIFKEGIRIGGGTHGGRLYNAQFNQIAYGSGGETKFGQWPNSPNNDRNVNPNYNEEHDMAYAFCWNNLDFLILEDCTDLVMFNNFDFGSKRGFILGNNGKYPGGICLGQGIDQGMNALYINGVDKNQGFNLINSQIVTTSPGRVLQNLRDNNRYIQVDPAFDGKVTLFAADFWGQPQNISIDVPNGTLELQAGNFGNSGQRAFAQVGATGAFDVIATNINPVGTLVTSGSNAQFYIQSSFVNKGNMNLSSFGLWWHNFDHNGAVSDTAGCFVDRTGWIATASVRNDDAMNTLDYNADTRWSTMSENQKPGQWFKVDMREVHTLTGIHMNPGTVTYQPVAVTVSLSDDDVTYRQVATARNTASIDFDQVQSARYIKVEQTGTSSTSWRIVEFLVMDSYLAGVAIPEIAGQSGKIWFAGNQIHAEGLNGRSTLKVYALSGQQVAATQVFENTVSVNLPAGIYIAVVENNGAVYREKWVKK